jgi:hypothetical protein
MGLGLLGSIDLKSDDPNGPVPLRRAITTKETLENHFINPRSTGLFPVSLATSLEAPEFSVNSAPSPELV